MSQAPSPTPAEAAAAAAVADARPPSLREWVRTHDESWIFVILYLGMAVGLSVFVSLFWLVLVAGLHFALEVFRQRFYREGKKSVFLHALWEIKLDIGLVLLALMLVLYIEVVLGILGVQSAARAAAVSRAGARIGTRAAAWERNLRTFLLTFDEMIRIAHAGVLMNRRRKKGKASAEGGAGAAAAASSEAPSGGVAVAASGDPVESPPVEAPEEAVPAAAVEETPEEAPPEETPEETPDQGPEEAPEDAPGEASEEASVVDAIEASAVGAVRAPSEGSPQAAADVEAEDAEGPTPAVPADGVDPGGAEAEAEAAPPEAAAPPPPSPVRTGPLPDAWSIQWKTSDRIGVALVVVGVLFILAAPLLTPHDWATAAEALAEELRPFPGS